MDLFRSSTFMSTTCNFLQYWICTVYQKATSIFSRRSQNKKQCFINLVLFYVQLLLQEFLLSLIAKSFQEVKVARQSFHFLKIYHPQITYLFQFSLFFIKSNKFYLLWKFSFNPTYIFFQNLSVTNLLFHVSCLFGVSSKHQQTGSESIQAMYCSQIFQIVFLGQNENDCIVTITTTGMDLEMLFRIKYYSSMVKTKQQII